MTPEIRNGILNHLLPDQAQDSAPQVLWVADSDEGLPVQFDCHYCRPEPAELVRHEQEYFDYAVLADLPGGLGKSGAEALLARMRDINAQRVFWVVASDAPWENRDAIALGFRELQKDESATLYGFDIENYKITPDWLNAKYWANPERWDKDRW